MDAFTFLTKSDTCWWPIHFVVPNKWQVKTHQAVELGKFMNQLVIAPKKLQTSGRCDLYSAISLSQTVNYESSDLIEILRKSTQIFLVGDF